MALQPTRVGSRVTALKSLLTVSQSCNISLTLTFIEKSLVALRKQQREKIEQIKKQTNYYTTRNLLERYDESTTVETPLGPRLLPRGAASAQIPVTPKRPTQMLQPPQTLQTPAPITPGLKQQLSRASPGSWVFIRRVHQVLTFFQLPHSALCHRPANNGLISSPTLS